MRHTFNTTVSTDFVQLLLNNRFQGISPFRGADPGIRAMFDPLGLTALNHHLFCVGALD